MWDGQYHITIKDGEIHIWNISNYLLSIELNL